jgi:omega-6 fatty acid desaturase (delta-12 desaturase)
MMDDSVTASTSLPAPGGPRRSWRDLVAPYASADPRRGWIQLLNTGLPFLALLAAMLVGTDHGFWAVLVLIAPAAALLVRLFMIQHDCGHGSFFKSRWANDLLGRALGVLTLTPYSFWRSAHAVHHATTGNLDRRGIGDIATLTVREYLSLPRWRRILYRVYRHPLVLFGIGPAYQFLLRHRIPTGHPVRQWRNWLSILGTNAALAAVVVAIALTIGLRPFLFSYVPICLLAASTGVWLFYVQHQFEETYWAVEFPCRGHGRLVVLRSAALPALGHRLYRLPPHPSSLEPDSELPATRVLQGESRAAPSDAHQPVGQSAMPALGAVGRDRAQARHLQPSASALARDLRRLTPRQPNACRSARARLDRPAAAAKSSP